MKATLGQLWKARFTFEELAAIRFKAKTSYRLMKIIEQINSELDPFLKARQALFEKYGEKEGDRINIKKENMEVFTEEMEELEKEEVELKFSVTLDDIETAELSPSQIYDLAFMLDEIAASQS